MTMTTARTRALTQCARLHASGEMDTDVLATIEAALTPRAGDPAGQTVLYDTRGRAVLRDIISRYCHKHGLDYANAMDILGTE